MSPDPTTNALAADGGDPWTVLATAPYAKTPTAMPDLPAPVAGVPLDLTNPPPGLPDLTPPSDPEEGTR